MEQEQSVMYNLFVYFIFFGFVFLDRNFGFHGEFGRLFCDFIMIKG